MSYAYIHILIFSQGDIIFVHNFQMAKSVRDWTHHRCACMDNLPLCMTGTAAPCLLAAEIADEMGKDRVTWYVWIDINTNYFLIKIMYKWIYALAACIANMYQYFVLCRCFFMWYASFGIAKPCLASIVIKNECKEILSMLLRFYYNSEADIPESYINLLVIKTIECSHVNRSEQNNESIAEERLTL